jgi:hypothetical protein
VEDYRTRNEAATTRLRELVQRLTDADLDRPLGGGWTVKAALLHMAFWDRFAGAALVRWARSGFTPSDEGDGSFINTAGLPDWLAAPSEYARAAVVAAAAATDHIAASLADPLCDAIEAGGEAWALNRHVHRTEHIEQIERALAGVEQPAQ